MRIGNQWRSLLLLALTLGTLLVSELVGAPQVRLNNPTGLYLLAQYKLAIGDTRSGLDLMDRAIAARSALLTSCSSLVNP